MAPGSPQHKGAQRKRKGPGRDKTSAKAIATAQRHARWMQDRIGGMTYAAIAQRDSVDVATVHEAVAKGLAAARLEPAKQLKDLSHQRLEAMLEGLWKRAAKGEESAVAQVLRIEERRAKLLGLDAPAEHKTRLTIVGQIQWVLDLIREELGDDASQRIYRRIAEVRGEEADPEDEARD